MAERRKLTQNSSSRRFEAAVRRWNWIKPSREEDRWPLIVNGHQAESNWRNGFSPDLSTTSWPLLGHLSIGRRPKSNQLDLDGSHRRAGVRGQGSLGAWIGRRG